MFKQISSVFQLFTAVIVGKYFLGRKYSTLKVSLVTALSLEIFEIVVMYFFNCGSPTRKEINQFTKFNFGKLIPDDENDHDYAHIDTWGYCIINDDLDPADDKEINWFRLLMGFKNTNFFLVFYMICWCGVIDVAKLEVLKNNRRMGANLYLTMLALQQVVQGIIFEPYIERIARSPWAWSSFAIIINSISLYNIRGLLKLEQQEVMKLKD